MKLITFPLKPGDNNSDVANLKAALQLLIEKQRIPTTDGADLIDLMNRETGYSDGTDKTVRLFQHSQHVPLTGIVDEQTAQIFNHILTELGAITDEVDNQGRIGGYVYLDFGIPAPNIKLRLYTKGFAGNDKIVTEVSTNEQGKYEFTFDTHSLNSSNF